MQYYVMKERKIRSKKNLVAAIATFSDSHPELELDKRSDTGHFLAAVETRDRQDKYRRTNNNRYHSMPAKFIDMRQIRCWTCNRTGHRARQCRVQGQNYGQYNSSNNYIHIYRQNRFRNSNNSRHVNNNYNRRQSPNSSPPRLQQYNSNYRPSRQDVRQMQNS